MTGTPTMAESVGSLWRVLSENLWFLLAVAGPPVFLHVRDWTRNLDIKRLSMPKDREEFTSLLMRLAHFMFVSIPSMWLGWLGEGFAFTRLSVKTLLKSFSSFDASGVSSRKVSESRPRSALKDPSRGGSSRSITSTDSGTSSQQQRVAFAEHSNGSVKTMNYYYDPNQSTGNVVPATISGTPETKVLSTTTPTKNQRKPLSSRIQTPPAKPRPRSQHQAVNGIPTPERKCEVPQTFSALVRKRQLEGKLIAPQASSSNTPKRQKGNRMALMGGHSRTKLLYTTTLSKREREERQENVLRQMNEKKPKVDVSKPPTEENISPNVQSLTSQAPKDSGISAPASNAQSQPSAAPPTGFNLAPSDANTIKDPPSTSVGTGPSVASVPTTNSGGFAPSMNANFSDAKPNSTIPAFNFGGTPAPVKNDATGSTGASDPAKIPQSSAPGTGAPSAPFAFGSAPAQPANTAPSIAPPHQGAPPFGGAPPTAGLSFGAPPVMGPSFGAPAPGGAFSGAPAAAAAPTFGAQQNDRGAGGASMRRRAARRHGRRPR